MALTGLPDPNVLIIPVTAAQGGTGFTSYAIGDTLYANSASTLAKLSAGTNGYVLTLAAGIPSWAANGGAALPGSYAVGDLIYASGAATLAKLVDVAVGSVLISGGVATAPAWSSSPVVIGTISAKPAATAGIQLDPNAATGNFTLSLSPANITAARRWSFPDRSDTVAGLAAQTFTGVQSISNATASTNATTGALVVTGGVGVLGVFNAGSDAAGEHSIRSAGGLAGVSCLFVGSGASPTAGNIYSIAVSKQGVDLIYLGINKNTTTGNVAANAVGFWSYGGASSIFIGRGSFGVPDKTDLLIAGATGDITVASASASTSTGTGALIVGGGIGAGGAFNNAQGTITAAAPTINSTVTWNAGAVTFAGWKLNVTNTASAAASLLMDLQLGGVSQFSVRKDGALMLPLVVVGGTVTASTPTFDAAQTWNAGGVTFTGGRLNITNTASAAASLFLDLQAGGVSQFSVGVSGLALVRSQTGGVGYGAAATGAVTQTVSKSTGVLHNAPCGELTLNNAALAGSTLVQFTLTCSSIGAYDFVGVAVKSGGTAGAYQVWAESAAAGSVVISVYNRTAGPLSEAVKLTWAVIKGNA